MRSPNEKHGGNWSKQSTASAVSDTCVVSAQGLIMILTASSAVSATLMIILAVVCIRYRVAISSKNRSFVTQRSTKDAEDTSLKRPSLESGEASVRRVNDKNTRWQNQQKSPSSSNSDVELARLSRPPHERRKHR